MSELVWVKLCGCSCGMESVAGGGEKSGVNMKLSEVLTLNLSPREGWFCLECHQLLVEIVA